MLNKLLARVAKFLRVDGLHVLGAYVGALAALLVAGGVPANAGALLALLPAAAVGVAKQLNAPAFVTNYLQSLENKVAPKAPKK